MIIQYDLYYCMFVCLTFRLIGLTNRCHLINLSNTHLVNYY